MFNPTNSQSLNQQLNNNSFQFSYSNQFNYNMSVNYCQSQLDFINNEQNRSPCFDNYIVNINFFFKLNYIYLLLFVIDIKSNYFKSNQFKIAQSHIYAPISTTTI